MLQYTELPRIFLTGQQTNPVDGIVRWNPSKSLWLISHYMIATIGGVLTFSLDAVAIFILTTGITLCLGHSLGMHRRLIHNSYNCPQWLEYLFVHLGVLVGMAGPFSMIKTHDIRDWAQRQPQCHSYLRHGQSFWRDGWWQLHCDLHLHHPPKFQLEPRIANDNILWFMEKTWMLQQLPLAILLFALGGLPWVIWGISVRVAVSVTGHWLIGYFAHNSGGMDHKVNGAAVQGHNVPWTAYLTMGESWHNNHHAFPSSAILGLYEDQPDPGWYILNALYNLGLAWDIRLPENLPFRANVRPVSDRSKNQGTGTKSLADCPLLSIFH